MLIALRQLRRKYLMLAALRAVREAAERRGRWRLTGAAAVARQEQARTLARAFPGALRELEALDAAALWQRARDVQAEWGWVRRGGPKPRRAWVRCVLDFHKTIAEAQQIRLWLRAHRAQGPLLQALLPGFRRWYGVLPGRMQAMHAVDAAFLRRYLRRPGGRLMTLVWDDLARRHRMTAQAVQQAVLGQGSTCQTTTHGQT